jgi:uncharacterized protein (DUF433 family)
MVHERNVVDPKVMFGKPVIKGTRVTVELILRKLAEGMTYEQILTHHPHLTVEDIRAAAFAADRQAADLAQLLRHAGAVDLGRPTGAYNERIDADLAREYGSSHEDGR